MSKGVNKGCIYEVNERLKRCMRGMQEMYEGDMRSPIGCMSSYGSLRESLEVSEDARGFRRANG